MRLRRDRRTHSAASRSPPRGSARRASRAGRREGSIGAGAGVGMGRVRMTCRAGMEVVRGVGETMSSKGEERLRVGVSVEGWEGRQEDARSGREDAEEFKDVAGLDRICCGAVNLRIA